MTEIPFIASMRPEPARDGRGQYLLPDPANGVTRAWTRATTIAHTLDDDYHLTQWKRRMVLQGVAASPDLLADVPSLTAALAEAGDDWRAAKRAKDALDQLCDGAARAAGAEKGSQLGTLLHTITEYYDAGRYAEIEHLVPDTLKRDVEAYALCMDAAGIERPAEYIERIVVNSAVDGAGTFDRLLRMPDGRLPVGDLKGLALTTPLPTPTGWTTMDAVRPGDQVFDAFGQSCTVIAKSDTKNIGTYVVRFDDGSDIVCDTEHIWWTSTGFKPGPPEPRPIAEVIATLSSSNGKQHRVPVARPLVLPEVDLPVEPYLFGCWLGNGDTNGGVICSMPELFEVMEQQGATFGKTTINPKSKAVRRSALGLRTQLRKAGLLGHKHIPDAYLRGSVEQRTRLLQGLMDTDGTWNKARRAATFYTVRKELALQVVELLASLGQRPNLAAVPTSGFGKTVTSYHVNFTPVDIVPFILPRKADQAIASTKPTTRSQRRVIVSVEPGPDVATACIAVDSPTRTYLCGDRMIPTHNTQKTVDFGFLSIAIQLSEYANADAMLDDDTGLLVPMPEDLDKTVGIVMHLPVGSATCTLYELDLVAGWQAALVAHETRQFRSRSKALGRVYTERSPGAGGDRLLYLIRTAGHPDALTALWRDAGDAWTPAHTDAARARKAELVEIP